MENENNPAGSSCASCAACEADTGRVEFTKEMKKDYTILIPGMLDIHFTLLRTSSGAMDTGWSFCTTRAALSSRPD